MPLWVSFNLREVTQKVKSNIKTIKNLPTYTVRSHEDHWFPNCNLARKFEFKETQRCLNAACLIFILVQLSSVIHLYLQTWKPRYTQKKRDLFCLVIRRGLRISFQVPEKFIKFLRNLSGLLKKRLALRENLKLSFSWSLFLNTHWQNDRWDAW